MSVDVYIGPLVIVFVVVIFVVDVILLPLIVTLVDVIFPLVVCRFPVVLVMSSTAFIAPDDEIELAPLII